MSFPSLPNPFSSASSSSSSSNISSPISSSTISQSAEIKSKIITAISQQSAVVNAKMLISKVNETCFNHCIPVPGASLSRKEETCLSACMEKYIDGWNTVNRTYIGRLQKEGAQLASGMAGGQPAGQELF